MGNKGNDSFFPEKEFVFHECIFKIILYNLSKEEDHIFKNFKDYK